jgi:multicomponent K+:H+ antiporter subunit E
MRYILPHPVLVLGILILWLLLNQSLSPGHLLLGTIIALAAAKSLNRLKVKRPRVRLTLAIPRLFFSVLHDIIRSNIAVGRIILSRRDHGRRRSGFIHVPLELRDTYGLAALAIIITATPGTIWVNYDRSRNLLMLHILDLVDEQEWITHIKTRYESRLMEIFQ